MAKHQCCSIIKVRLLKNGDIFSLILEMSIVGKSGFW